MKIQDGSRWRNYENEVLSAALASLCFLVVIAIFITKLIQQAGSCCRDLCYGKNKGATDNKNESSYTKMGLRAMSQYYEVPLSAAHKNRSKSFNSMDSLDSFKYAVFEIPGQISSQPVQPYEDYMFSGATSTSNLSEGGVQDISSDGRVFIDEYIQPSEKDLLQPNASPRDSPDLDNPQQKPGLEGALDPLLYSPFLRKRTQGASSLGKIKFSLQYEDRNKKKLIMTLNEITGVHFSRAMENVVGLYISALLLPERDYRFESSHLQKAEQINLSEVFTFHSRPMNRDFESRTIQFTVVFIEKNSKQIVYGESRLPLLSHEIYSQVPTDFCIGIKPCPNQHELGDAHIMLSYSSEHQKLSVLVKCVKFINPTLLENLTGVHIKAHLSRLGGDRLGKKRHISKKFKTKSVNFVDFEDHLTFRLQPENFMLCTLKINLHGKHRIMGKHFSLGRIRIGDNNRDEAGKAHWKATFNSEGIGWSVWHPIYAT